MLKKKNKISQVPLSIVVSSRTENLLVIRDFVSRAAQSVGFGDDEINNISLAVDEACSNIIKHAYNNAADKEIQITISAEGPEFQIKVIDQGKHFDPDHIPVPDMKEYFTRYKRGGLGMFLMKKLMDKVEYDILPDQNVVRLTKYLPM